MSLRAIVTATTQADCSHAGSLVDGLKAEHLIADKGYFNFHVRNACAKLQAPNRHAAVALYAGILKPLIRPA